MGARTIRSGIGTYMDADGQWKHGVLGDEVEVHEDDLERFDRLNPEAPEDRADSDESDDDGAPDAPSFSQEDVDSLVKAAVEAKDTELADAKKALDEKTQEAADAAKELDSVKAELDALKAGAAKAPAKK